jgi:hypothetical protein
MGPGGKAPRIIYFGTNRRKVANFKLRSQVQVSAGITTTFEAIISSLQFLFYSSFIIMSPLHSNIIEKAVEAALLYNLRFSK